MSACFIALSSRTCHVSPGSWIGSLRGSDDDVDHRHNPEIGYAIGLGLHDGRHLCLFRNHHPNLREYCFQNQER